ARRALAVAPGPDTQVLTLLSMAETGEPTRARELTNQLKDKFPSGTLLQNYWIPTILAETELALNNALGAIELLRRTGPYDFSSDSPMLPVYVRGKAYLAAKEGHSAAAEFQKILDHPGIIGNDPVGALAHLGLARAFALSGNLTAARAEYESFFTRWKDADQDVPILRQAKSEYSFTVR